MSFDRKDFSSLALQRSLDTKAAHKGDLTVIRQAAVAAEYLLGTPEWDVFLSYLQAGVVEAAKARDGFMRDLANPLLVDPNAVAQKRIAVIRLNDRIETLQRVIAMPVEIGKHGKIADEKLKELSKLEEGDQAA
jgi:hypothetical protein